MRQRFDPAKPRFLSIFGRKGSGKSVLAEHFWTSWPYCALSIDPTGDFHAGEGAEVLTDPLPARLTMPDRGEPAKRWVYRPDPGSANYADDLDRAIGLAFWTPKEVPMLLQVDEIAEVTGASKTGANMRRVLHQHRHRALTVIACGPRTKDLNPLVLSQSDFAYFFKLPHPLDQDRAAQVCGINPTVFADAMKHLPKYHYLRYDADPDPKLATAIARAEGISDEEALDALRLVQMPPVPLASAKEAAP